MKKIRLTCSMCKGVVVFENRSEYDDYQAHQQLHRKGCDYKAHCHVNVYMADVENGGKVLHKKGDPFMVPVKDHEGKTQMVAREYVEQFYLCEVAIPLETEVLS